MNASARPTIIVVEDDATLGWMVSTILQQLVPEYAVHICADGLEALAYLIDHTVCCVITDYMMPSMDGLTLSEIMTSTWPTIPVILITGEPRASVERQLKEKQTNFVTIVEKPLSIGCLCAALLPLLAASDASLALVDNQGPAISDQNKHRS